MNRSWKKKQTKILIFIKTKKKKMTEMLRNRKMRRKKKKMRMIKLAKDLMKILI